MSEQRFAIDRSLRELLAEIAVTLDGAERPAVDEIFLSTPAGNVSLNENDDFLIQRVFAGFRWSMALSPSDLPSLVAGEVREWPMTRLGAAESEATLSGDAINRILGSLGFDGDAEEPEGKDETTVQAPSQPGQKSLSGLEDGIEEDVDFGSVSESDLDAFLNAYQTATGEHPVVKPEAAPEPEPETKQEDPTLALFEKLLAAEEEEDEEDEEEVNERSVESAQGFLDILVKKEKLELSGTGNPENIAEGLAPLLDAEQPSAQKAEIIIDWLLDQDEIEDIFVSDEEMIALLNIW